MLLDERKTKILHAIVKNYLATGEPVGSRTISKDTDLNLSSATIRNEMADLEEMGLILQPHTSAGRIPSDRGYRIYVDEMLRSKEREVDEMKELLLEREEKLEKMLKQVARLLAVNTNYATMISAPALKGNRLKFIQISRVDTAHLLATVVMEGNVIKNRMIDVSENSDDETILKLNMLLNTRLNGLCADQITLGMIAAMKKEAGEHGDVIARVVDAAAETIREDDNLEIYTSGTNNIFRYPELADKGRASALITTFEEKTELESIALKSLSQADQAEGIQVYIGEEAPAANMQDCSVVTATYDLGDGMRGTVGVIGPKRMDYDRVVAIMKNVMRQLDDLYKKE
ncbi:MAG: heat-inducible transcriptional repressor HrcA [Lachnospiraceae bacterium]|nr:heat-inducible transcriptional repressor HrcA [Lachnospiraceae bacterium]